MRSKILSNLIFASCVCTSIYHMKVGRTAVCANTMPGDVSSRRPVKKEPCQAEDAPSRRHAKQGKTRAVKGVGPPRVPRKILSSSVVPSHMGGKWQITNYGIISICNSRAKLLSSSTPGLHAWHCQEQEKKEVTFRSLATGCACWWICRWVERTVSTPFELENVSHANPTWLIPRCCGRTSNGLNAFPTENPFRGTICLKLLRRSTVNRGHLMPMGS